MVHIIPLSVARRRSGNAAQDGSSPAGGASQQLDGYWQEVAQHYAQRKAQQQAFDTEIAARKLDGEIAKAEADAVANAPADGTGLHQGMYGEVDPHTGRVLQTGRFDTLFKGFLSQVRPELHPGLAARKETLRTEGSWRMAAHQLQRRRDYEKAAVDATLTTNAIAIGKADPDDLVTFEAARQQGLDLIDRMGVDPGIRQQMAKDWYSTAAKARFEALIARDPDRAVQVFGARSPDVGGQPASDSAQPGASALSRSSTVGPGGTQTPDERIARAFRDDLPKEEQDALALKAKVSKFTRDVDLRVAIASAEADAPDEIARKGAYSGKMPGKDAFRIVYGLDEGDRRWRVFKRQSDVGRQVFGMHSMTNKDIHAALRDAESGPVNSQEDQDRRDASATAVKLVMDRRRTDAGRYVGQSPEIFAGWTTAFATDPSDPKAYDQINYDKTIALSVAMQKSLGVEDEHLQPIPLFILLKLADDRDSGNMYQMENYARWSEVFARTKDPVVRAALGRELDDVGLGGILPSGRPGLSTGEVFQSEGKGLGKAIANAAVGAGRLTRLGGYGVSSGSIDPSAYKRRMTDYGGRVSEASPEIFEGWKAALGNSPSDPESFDQDAYDRTIELSVAKQKELGIDDENLQPIPFSYLLKIDEDRNSGNMYLMDNYAKATELFRRTKGPVARAALARQLDDAGLGGILPEGKPRLSMAEVFRADARAFAKAVTNPGIITNSKDWVARGMSEGGNSLSHDEDAYYQPSNNTEKVMMRQGYGALDWMPVPVLGRAAKKVMPRAFEPVGPEAAGRADDPIATKSFANSEAANNSISEIARGKKARAQSAQTASQAGGHTMSAPSLASRSPLKIQRPEGFKLDIWTAPMVDAAREVLHYARSKFSGKVVVNAEDGSSIIIRAKSLKHSLSSGAGQISRSALAAALKLDDLIASAHFVETVPDRLGRAEIINVHHYERAITMDGHDALIHIVVRENRDGRRYYDHYEIRRVSSPKPK